MSSVLITSASRGIGLEFVRQYAADGWQVFAACRAPATASELESIARASEGQVELLAMDVTDGKSVRSAATRLRDMSIDVLINSAGIMGSPKQDLGEMDYASWAAVLEVNTMGPMRVTEAFVEHVGRSERKIIVTITSGMGSLADNSSGGWIAYRSSKAGVNMVMRTVALDLKSRGVICVLLNPGWVKTDMGGPNANLTVESSVSSMRSVIARLTPADTGKFFHHKGNEFPW